MKEIVHTEFRPYVESEKYTRVVFYPEIGPRVVTKIRTRNIMQQKIEVLNNDKSNIVWQDVNYGEWEYE